MASTWLRAPLLAAAVAAFAAAGCTRAVPTAEPMAVAAAGAGASASPGVPTVADDATAGVAGSLGPWRLTGRTDVLGPVSDQGLASVAVPGGSHIVYRGADALTPALRAQGWTHVGAPGAWGGWLLDAFQGRAAAKMFRVTAPDGAVTEVVHPLAAGESGANSFAAVSPDGRWVVSGEWGEERRLLVFGAPLPPGSGAAPLALAGTVTLDRLVRDVQGCTFVGPATLVCETADPGTDLWAGPDQLLEVDLGRPLGAGADPATVTSYGSVPEVSGCRGTYEPEGDSYHDGVLRVEVVPPGDCRLETQVYEYRREAASAT